MEAGAEFGLDVDGYPEVEILMRWPKTLNGAVRHERRRRMGATMGVMLGERWGLAVHAGLWG